MKRTMKRNLLLAALALSASGIAAGDPDRGVVGGESQIQRGLAISPVPLNLAGKNRSLVALGSYIVNAQGGCNDCHTWRVDATEPGGGSNYEAGGNPFLGEQERIYAAGYLGGGRPFFGPVISRNLTPDASGLPLGSPRSRSSSES
jgi:hypothetical protein